MGKSIAIGLRGAAAMSVAGGVVVSALARSQGPGASGARSARVASSRLPVAAQSVVSRVIGRDGAIYQTTRYRTRIEVRTPRQAFAASFSNRGVEVRSRRLRF